MSNFSLAHYFFQKKDIHFFSINTSRIIFCTLGLL